MRLSLPRFEPRPGGFTIIELLVAVVIGGILITAAIASYRNIGQKQAVRQAGVSFQTDLKNYQQKALAGVKPDACVGENTLAGFRIRYVSNQRYSLAVVCRDSIPAVVTVSLPGEVRFAAAFSADIFFPVLSSAVTGAQSIILRQGSYGYRVTIENSGVIRGEML